MRSRGVLRCPRAGPRLVARVRGWAAPAGWPGCSPLRALVLHRGGRIQHNIFAASTRSSSHISHIVGHISLLACVHVSCMPEEEQTFVHAIGDPRRALLGEQDCGVEIRLRRGRAAVPARRRDGHSRLAWERPPPRAHATRIILPPPATPACYRWPAPCAMPLIGAQSASAARRGAPARQRASKTQRTRPEIAHGAAECEMRP